MKKTILCAVLFLLVVDFGAAVAARSEYNVRDFGAKGDGEYLCTEAIQKAVDKCAKAGGGTVYFPAGKWLTGTVYLESNVTVLLENGCTVLGSKEKKDYGALRRLRESEDTFSYWAIFAGKGLKNVAIRGRGTMDGQGANFKYKNGSRPKNIYLEDCSDVLIEGVRLRNAGSWMQHYRNCDRVTIRDIAVFNHVSYNNDGLNIDSCRDVVITGCVVDSDDDAIVIKSLSGTPCENINISNCIVSSHCNAIKMGTESGGGFQNIAITNCNINSPRYSEVIYGRQRGLAGLALEIVDGGTLERVAISNITIKGVSVPIFMRLGNRARKYVKGQPDPDVGKFRDVIIDNVIATDCSAIGCLITGLGGHCIENVTLSDISLSFDGGGTKEDASREISEKPTSYPESTMFGTLPAYGFFCRHVKDLRFRNVRVEASTPDYRHSIVLDGVKRVVIDSLDAAFTPGAEGMIRLTNAQDVSIRNCRPGDGTDLFVELRGADTDNIVLFTNDLRNVEKVSRTGPGVPKSCLVLNSNQTRQ